MLRREIDMACAFSGACGGQLSFETLKMPIAFFALSCRDFIRPDPAGYDACHHMCIPNRRKNFLGYDLNIQIIRTKSHSGEVSYVCVVGNHELFDKDRF